MAWEEGTSLEWIAQLCRSARGAHLCVTHIDTHNPEKMEITHWDSTLVVFQSLINVLIIFDGVFFLLLRDSASCCLWFSSKQMTFRTGTRWCLSLGDTHIQEAEFAAWRPQTKTTFKCKFSRLHYWSTHSILYSTRVRSCFFFFCVLCSFSCPCGTLWCPITGPLRSIGLSNVKWGSFVFTHFWTARPEKLTHCESCLQQMAIL